MDTLIAAVSGLASARSREDIAHVVRTFARQITGADGVTFVMREAGQCFYAEEDAIAPLWKGKRFPLESCISGWSMLHRQAVAIPDIYLDARIPHDAYRPTFVKSLLMMPVGIGDPVAAIGAYWATKHDVTPNERKLLESLSHAAALSLRNIQLDADLILAIEKERLAREEAERLSSLKDHFLATLSHELRTPLHIIRNWVWQLKKFATDERTLKAAEVIERNAALQGRLVEDLLDLSRAAAGTLKIDLMLVDLTAMCAAVIEVVQPAASDKSISLHFEADHSPQIWADADRIQQILWNILTNAIKFTPAGGNVTVRVTRRVRHACVSVSDSGIGIDAEFLPHMFERFRQAEMSVSRRFGGLGLGLSIVKELVTLHRGTVHAESDGPNKGSTVTVEFPVPVVSDQPGVWLKRRAGIDPLQGRLDGMSVLIVDDEDDALTALEAILMQSGAQVFKAQTADDALKLLSEHHPTVVVSDLAMPSKDGFALIAEIRKLPTPDAHVPVAALSAYVASDFQSQAEQAGFQSYIEKPVSPDELVGHVRLLAGSKAVH